MRLAEGIGSLGAGVTAWVLGTKLKLSAGAAGTLNTEPSLQPEMASFKLREL